MSYSSHPTFTAFLGHRRIGTGSLRAVATAIKETHLEEEGIPVLIFDDEECQPVELDLRGTLAEVLERLPQEEAALAEPLPVAAPGPGRPKLGVVAREVTLLPRHWEWLARQPGGTSVALRKLVEQARHASEEPDRLWRAQEATYRFLSAVAGNLPGFEEASRAFFAKDKTALERHCAAWPKDVSDHTLHLAKRTCV
ncbi:hypothetical protein SAMN05444156_2359 [Verrucomicrobium sp. GAS474]|uniref:DUF2239 family protein n=1 Tax=Verrucomicrobium sp. GAS474 TaxID=1882831 RepID=UPI000879C99D|nr:DUF2239 family protein [Verrucomicrobium sp. GAS474]SDU16594.1 hypothetical protein SAMN05444156_2359 [Verrucomicrobium sp. GAS474]